jgi:hypothetical protein
VKLKNIKTYLLLIRKKYKKKNFKKLLDEREYKNQKLLQLMEYDTQVFLEEMELLSKDNDEDNSDEYYRTQKHKKKE